MFSYLTLVNLIVSHTFVNFVPDELQLSHTHCFELILYGALPPLVYLSLVVTYVLQLAFHAAP